jgi:hypothetical protein
MQELIAALKRINKVFHPVVPFNGEREKLVALDFTADNSLLTPDIVESTEKLGQFINQYLEKQNARYGIGGYGELRALYSRSPIIRRHKWKRGTASFHLGVDIWGAAGTTVFAP